MKFEGTETYIATEDLTMAVNAAIALERPLLVKGEPGTGKTILAHEVARALGHPLIEWHIKSTTKAQQGLYEYDAVSRLRDSQLGDERVTDIANYIKPGKLWEAFVADTRPVVLIDEIDKADIEFPNDLLLELDHLALVELFDTYTIQVGMVKEQVSLFPFDEPESTIRNQPLDLSLWHLCTPQNKLELSENPFCFTGKKPVS